VLTLLEMAHSLFIGSSVVTFRHAAFELKGKQILLHIPMKIVERNSLISTALFRTRIVILLPRRDACLAKQGLAAAALLRIFDDHCADGTDKEVGSFPLFFVFFDEVGKIEMRFWESTISLRLVRQAFWVLDV